MIEKIENIEIPLDSAWMERVKKRRGALTRWQLKSFAIQNIF